MHKSFARSLRFLTWAALFIACAYAPAQIISIQALNSTGQSLQSWNSGRWVLQCGSTLSCSVSADGSTLIMQSSGGGGGASPGGAQYSVQFYQNSTTLGGVSGTGLVMANGTSSAPTITPLYGTEGYIPTIVNGGTNGDAVLFGSAGLVDSGYVPENVTHKGAANGYAPLNGSSQVPAANLPVATTSVLGVIKPDGTTCVVTAGVLTCAAAGASQLNTLPYDVVTNNASNTAGHDTFNFVADATNTAQNAVNAAYTNSGMATITPAAGYTPFTNVHGVKVDDKRINASARSASEWGAQCDSRMSGVSVTLNSTTATISFDYFYPADVGKVIAIVGNIAGVPTAFESVIASLPSSPSRGSTATLTTPAPFTGSGLSTIAHDDTAALAQGMSSGSPLLFPAGTCLTHTISYTGISMMGINGYTSALQSFPGEDLFAEIDPATGFQSEGDSVHIHDMTWNVDNRIDATQGWQIINDTGTVAKTPMYRPVAIGSAIAQNPLGPGWFRGSGANGTGAFNGVANVTAASAVICVNSAAIPAVGQTIVFPYLSSVFTTTVASTSGTCGAGTARTLTAAMPAGSTAAVSEFMAGTTPQSVAAAISSGACPATITLNNSILPSPAGEANVGPYGLIKIDGEEFSYFGRTNAYTGGLGANTLYNLQCAQNGTTRAAHALNATVVPLNAFQPSYPYPVPTITSGDTTPSGTAAFYPPINVGNVAFSAGDTNGSIGLTGVGSFANSVIDNILIQAVGYFSLPLNNTGGIYLVSLPYSTQFRSITISGTTDGVMEGTPSLETGGRWNSAQPTADGTSWENVRISTCNNFDFISGSQNSFRDFNVYSQCYANSAYTGAGAGMYFTEGWNDEGVYPQSIMGNIDLHNMYEEAEFGSQYGLVNSYEFDISRAEWDNLHVGAGTEMDIGGNNQHFNGGNFNTGTNIPVINYGSANTSTYANLLGSQSGYTSNTYGSSGFINYGINSNFSGAMPSGAGISNTVTMPYAALQLGNSRATYGGQNNETWNLGNTSVPFVDSNGGYIPAWEFNTSRSFESNPMTVAEAYDATSPNFASVGCYIDTLGASACFENRFNQAAIPVALGQRIVPGKYTAYVASHSSGAATQYGLKVGVCGLGDSAAVTVPVTSAWSVFSFPVDFTGKSCGGGISLYIASASPANDTIYFAYVDFAPVAQNLIATAANIGTLTSGSVLASSITDGALTNGQCVQAGAGGVLTTTGSACGAGGGGGGGISSVSLVVPAWLAVAGSPITGAGGTFTVTSTSQVASQFLASPSTGSGVMTPRAITVADVPTLNQNTTGSAGAVNSNVYPAAASIVSGGVLYGSGASTVSSSALLNQYGVMYGGGVGVAPSATAADTNTTHALFATGTSPAFRAILSTDIPILNQNTTGNAATASSTSTVNGNTFPASAGFVSGGIPYYSSTSSEVSSALLTHYGVLYGGGVGAAPVATAASTTTAQALFATATAPAFRNLISTDLPVGSSSQIGGLLCGAGTVCTAGTIALASNTATASSTLTAGYIPAATGAASMANSKLNDGITTANTLTYVGTGGISASGNIQSAANMGAVNMTSSTMTTGTMTISGATTLPSIQNSVSGSPITVLQAGGGVLALNVQGGLELTAAIELNGSFGTAGQCALSGGSSSAPAVWGACPGSGGSGLTSIGLSVPSWLTVAGSPLTANGTLAVTATSEAGNLFLASPNSTTGVMAPRAIVAADIPTLNQNTTGSAASVPYSGLTGSVPTWNQNTTGTAAGLLGCTPTTAGSLCYWNGTAWALIVGNTGVTQYLQETASGIASWTSPGTVNTGTVGRVGYYAATGTALGPDASLDDGLTTTGTLTYTGTNGISAKTFSTTGTGVGGTITLKGATSGALSITVPSVITNYSATMPPTAPTTGNTYLSCTVSTTSICSWAPGGGGGGGAFSGLTGGTNTTAAMLVGSGASLGVTGSGTINSTTLNSNIYPASAGFTSGGIPYFSGNNQEGSSPLLNQFGVVYGGGVGGSPASTSADTNTAHALFATGTAPAFRAILASDIPTLNQNTTGVAAALSDFSVATWGTTVSASTLTLPGTGGYAVISGTATVSIITPPSGCTGSYACTYMLLSANGFSILNGNATLGAIDSGAAPIGATIQIPSGTMSYFTFDPVNGLWHFMSQPTIYNPIYTHTLTGATPTIALNSAVIAGQDTNSLVMSANVTSIALPTAVLVADGEEITLYITQPASGGPYTIAPGTAQSPLTVGSGTTLINTVPGGCPTIGTVVSSTAPSQLIMTIAYRAALSQYQILGCQTAPAQSGVVESSLVAAMMTYGAYAQVNITLAGTQVTNGGHFTNLQTTGGGGTCSTPPTFNIFDGTTNVGVAVTPPTVTQTKGVALNQPETLSFNAGDNVGIYLASVGAGCSTGYFSVTAQYVEP